MQSIDLERFGEAPALSPMIYPGARPDTSFVYVEGRLLTLESADPAVEAGAWLRATDRAPLRSRVAVLCLGSNASPPQIHRKVGHDRGTEAIVLLQATVRGVRPVYAGHVARYGAIPATGDIGTRPRTLFLALYTRDQLETIYRSESRSYDLCRLHDAEVTAGPSFSVEAPYAFLARKGVLNLSGAGAVALDDVDQTQLIRSLLEQTALGRRVSFEAYASDPASHRRVLESAIEDNGLRRPHRLRHCAVALDEAHTLGAGATESERLRPTR